MTTNRVVRCLLAAGILMLSACATAPAKPEETQADPDVREVDKGVEMVMAGQVQAAIDGPLTGVVNRFETAYAQSDKRIFSSRGARQKLLYTAVAEHAQKDGTDKRSVIFVGPAWSMAYWARGFAYAEMARYPEAETELVKALKLSPLDAKYMLELGHVVQAQHRYSESLTIYTDLPVLIALMEGWPPSLKLECLCRAYRGQGYSLSELGRLDDAEKAYGECLKIIPDEPTAKTELEWIAEQKARKK